MSVETITVEQLRDEVRRAVEETSARAVGRVVKLSASGLYNFINGQGRLYAPSKRRLTAWYLERRARAAHIPAPSADEVSAAVTLLLRDVEQDGPTATAIREQIAACLDRVWATRPGGRDALAAVATRFSRPDRQPLQDGPVRSLLVVAVLPDHKPLVRRLTATLTTPLSPGMR